MKNTTSQSRVRAVVLGLSVASIACVMASCNTVKGAGTDITRAGEAGQRVITGGSSGSGSSSTTTTTESK
jgi:predicted small secreted protein